MSLVTETVREKARARTEREKSPAMKTVRGGFCFRKDHREDMVTETLSVASKRRNACVHSTLHDT